MIDNSWFYQKNTILSKYQNKAEFKKLDDFEVLSSNFPGLITWASTLTSTASATAIASSTSTSLFQQRTSWPWAMATKWPIMNNGPSFRNGSSKIQFFTKIGTFSVGGWWGHPMLLFWKLVVIPRNIKITEFQNHLEAKSELYISIVRLNSKGTFQYYSVDSIKWTVFLIENFWKIETVRKIYLPRYILMYGTK